MEYRKDNNEFSEEELMNVQGGFQHMAGNIHPFEDSQIYGENQKEKIQDLREQLEEVEQKHCGRSR